MTRKPKPVRLWQEIVLALSLKVVLLAAIWAVWFSAPQDRTIDGQHAAAYLLYGNQTKEPYHDADTGAR